MPDKSNAAATGLSIRQWLVLLGVGTAILVLLVSIAGFVLLESIDSRQAAEREGTMLSKMVIAHTSAAVGFSDAEFVRRALQSLGAVASVSRACIYNGDGEVFAQYLRHSDANEPGCPKAVPSGISIQKERVGLTSPILVGDEVVGSFYLESSVELLGARIARKARVGIPLLLGAVVLAGLFAMRVQRRLENW